MELSEAEVKSGVEEYLQIAMNQGHLYFERMNSGDFIEVRGNTRRRVKGARKGTADFIVIQGGEVLLHQKNYPITIVTFIEIKSTKGQQSPSQREFEIMVKGYHCRYVIVRSVEDLEEVLR